MFRRDCMHVTTIAISTKSSFMIGQSKQTNIGNLFYRPALNDNFTKMVTLKKKIYALVLLFDVTIHRLCSRCKRFRYHCCCSWIIHRHNETGSLNVCMLPKRGIELHKCCKDRTRNVWNWNRVLTLVHKFTSKLMTDFERQLCKFSPFLSNSMLLISLYLSVGRTIAFYF